MFRTDAVKYALIGLMRDLRGIAMATNRHVVSIMFEHAWDCLRISCDDEYLWSCSRRTYGLLFDWLYPAHMPLLLKGISHWSDTPEVCFRWLIMFLVENWTHSHMHSLPVEYLKHGTSCLLVFEISFPWWLYPLQIFCPCIFSSVSLPWSCYLSNCSCRTRDLCLNTLSFNHQDEYPLASVCPFWMQSYDHNFLKQTFLVLITVG